MELHIVYERDDVLRATPVNLIKHQTTPPLNQI